MHRDDSARIRLRHVSKSFERKFQIWSGRKSCEHRQVLSDISLDVGQGDIVTIVGKNGSGKTTLTRILSTLVTPERGEAIVCGFRSEERRVGKECRCGG